MCAGQLRLHIPRGIRQKHRQFFNALQNLSSKVSLVAAADQTVNYAGSLVVTKQERKILQSFPEP